MSITENNTVLPNMSRRNWLKLAGVGATALSASPFLSACAQDSAVADTADGASSELAILSSNENPFGPSPKAIEAMKAEVANIYRYTYPSVMALTEQIAKRENVSPDQILITNGSQPILGHFSVWANSKDLTILTSELTYEGVPRVAEAFGSTVDYSPVTADLDFDLDTIAAKVKPGTCAYICNPNNPTGKIIDPAKLDAFVDTVSAQVPVFIDEAYLDIADDYEKQVMTKYVRMGRPVIVARTFSKIYGMAGQRVGYALMPADMIKEFASFQLLSNVNKLGLVAASASLDDTAHFEEMRVKMKLGREKLIAMARDIGRPIAENPQGSFIYMDTGMAASEFAAKMMDKGVRVVGSRWQERPEWSRICVGLPHEIEKCHAAAKEVLTSI
ncbi:MAG: histidinol phosphate aminotransferase [Ponticaulis sp.]|nr:histidinol phosphate aminotransferase [Ponticaulis sp.]|tara:strand:+ start:3425 stop:4588 length:1164 start_codon:yes stop_codon:yes gene_type:complete